MSGIRAGILTPEQYARLDELDADVPPLTPEQVIALKRIFSGTIPDTGRGRQAVNHAA